MTDFAVFKNSFFHRFSTWEKNFLEIEEARLNILTEVFFLTFPRLKLQRDEEERERGNTVIKNRNCEQKCLF